MGTAHKQGLTPAPAAVRRVAPIAAALLPVPAGGLLRFSTAGSVDDGKSTLIGRLLYDTRSVPDDQLLAVDAASRRRGEDLNLALLTDGLRAEREQNITIDVAYRYFATAKRRFIIADTPGHAQYTRNMVTGASNAELALILLDARKGVLTQSRRHAFAASLLGIRHFLIAVNKMDLVDYSASSFEALVKEFGEFASRLEVGDVVFVPVSALHGDNVVARSRNMPWYEGPTLLHHLENVNIAVDRNLTDFRFPVQCVLRPHQDYRGLAGEVASGVIRPGEQVMILPSRVATRVRRVEQAGNEVKEASAGSPAVLILEDHVDVSRGDMVVRSHNLPIIGSEVDAMLCWLSDEPLRPDADYIMRHTSRTVKARVASVEYRIDIETLHRQEGGGLGANEIGRAAITTGETIFIDPFSRNRVTGCFTLIDPFTQATVAAGVIRGESRSATGVTTAAPASSPGAVWAPWHVPRDLRERRNGHRGAVIWLTGYPGSGKSTLARALEERLFSMGCQTMLLDGDQLRHGLCADLGFGREERRENIRRAGQVARLFYEHGDIVICAFVSPYEGDRDAVRQLIGQDGFIEVLVDCRLEECQRRDPKKLYAAASSGTLTNMTGIGQPYEPPRAPDFTARTQIYNPGELAQQLLDLLTARAFIR